MRDVGVELAKAKVTFRPRLRGDADVELEAAVRRAKYFGKVFECHVDFEESSSAS